MNAKHSFISSILPVSLCSQARPLAAAQPVTLASESADIPFLPRRHHDLDLLIEKRGGDLVRIVITNDGEPAMAILALAGGFLSSPSGIQLRGPLVIEGPSPEKSVPLLDANLTLRRDAEAAQDVLVGTACVPLPTFGLFNGISVDDPVQSHVSVRFGEELGEIGAHFRASDLGLCFEFDRSAVADGPMVSVSTPSTDSRLVLNPRTSAFMLHVEQATFPGLELRLGRLGVAPGPVFGLARKAQSAPRPGRGKFELCGLVEIKPLDLVVSGTVIADLTPGEDGEAIREPRLQLSAEGDTEFVGNVGGDRKARFDVKAAAVLGWVEEDAARVSLRGRLGADQIVCLANDLKVTCAQDAEIEALLSTNAQDCQTQVRGDLMLDLWASPEDNATGLLKLRGRLQQAELGSTPDRLVVTGLWDGRRAPLLGLSGWLSVKLEVGPLPDDWTLSIQAPGSTSRLLRPSRRVAAAS